MSEIIILVITFSVGFFFRFMGVRKSQALLLSSIVTPAIILMAEFMSPVNPLEEASPWLFSLICGSILGLQAGWLGVSFASYIFDRQAGKILLNTIVILLIGTYSLSAIVKSESCNPLSDEAHQLVKPILDKALDWEGLSLLDKLLVNQSPEADEALAYLVNLYDGALPGERIKCEVINRGKKMLPLVEMYKECTPPIERNLFEPKESSMSVFADEAIEEIKKGKRCQFENIPS